MPDKRLLIVLAALALHSSTAWGAPPVDFNRDVRPILAGSCFKCHGPDEGQRQAGLRLDVRESALAAGESGELAIVPGKPDASELVARILSDDPDTQMPPPAMKRPLTAAQKDILRRWVAEGAEYRPHWAFQPPQRAPLPTVKDQAWPANAIDHFVLARLEREQLTPSPAADRYTQVRRVYLDLIGLPPTPAEADAFVNDRAPDAYERLVDRLLASPAYGERWARRWLDLARYADTNGYEKDRVRSIWPYRDWLIQSLNADLPFDRFTVEQLAGDMLPEATQAQRIATGFHRNTMINEEGGIDPQEFRYYSVVDRINTTATAWLGLTLGCAQCHTHKYDPIPHREYFAMFAFLNNADEPVLPVPTPEAAARRAELLAQVAEREQTLPEHFPAQSPLRWQVANIDKLTADSKATFEKLAEGAYRVAGETPAQDSYTLEFTSDLENIAHLKLEALTDAALPSTGPGRTPHGNFVLTEIQVHVAPRAGDAATPVKIASASADFEQEKYPAADAIDGNPKSGWAIQGPGQWNTNRAATFVFEKPVTIAGGTKWTITLQQHYGSQHTLGKFRLSLGQTIHDPNQQLSGRERFNAELAKWIAANAPSAVTWTPLTPASATSDSPTLTVLDDGSVLASGDQTKRDQYRLQYKFAKQTITAIRLDAIADDRLPQRGPGRIYYEGPAGDFFLSEVTAQAGDQQVSFAKAVQSSGTNAQMAIDGDPQSGWSINGGQGRDHSAIFVLKEPLRDVDTIQLQLLFERYYAAGLGRFRVSVTDAAHAAERVKLPVAVEQALRAPHPNTADVLVRYFASIAPELAGERAAIEKLRQQSPEIPTTLAMVERPSEHPRKTLLRHRGEFLQPKEEVAANVLSVLNPLPADQPRTRLAFAKWLVNGDSPLTGRVTVNRQWAAFFGRGLVKTTEDFGLQGDLPSHPELLDWLAIEFVERSWSMKDLHRLIVTSSTYRQASRITPALAERDPQNVLLARGPRVRLEGELVRDNALRIAGLLSYKVGGPSVFPPQPASVTTEGAYGGLKWNVSPGEDRYRRGLYTFAKRTAPFAMLGTFDGPSGEACVARREVSNSPLQALVLLNDEVFLEVAQTLGREFAAGQGDDTARLTALFRRVLVRPPTTMELAALTNYVQTQRQRFESKELDAAAIAGPGEQANERALWTVVARALLNLDETITKD